MRYAPPPCRVQHQPFFQCPGGQCHFHFFFFLPIQPETPFFFIIIMSLDAPAATLIACPEAALAGVSAVKNSAPANIPHIASNTRSMLLLLLMTLSTAACRTAGK
jgi:hypothetical protein